MLTQLKALTLLSECTGEDIWSVEYCRNRGIPSAWIEELADCYESGFGSESQTIYYEDRVVSQYHGVRDVDLAFKLAEYLGVDSARATNMALGRAAEVRALKEAVEEG